MRTNENAKAEMCHLSKERFWSCSWRCCCCWLMWTNCRISGFISFRFVAEFSINWNWNTFKRRQIEWNAPKVPFSFSWPVKMWQKHFNSNSICFVLANSNATDFVVVLFRLLHAQNDRMTNCRFVWHRLEHSFRSVVFIWACENHLPLLMKKSVSEFYKQKWAGKLLTMMTANDSTGHKWFRMKMSHRKIEIK